MDVQFTIGMCLIVALENFSLGNILGSVQVKLNSICGIHFLAKSFTFLKICPIDCSSMSPRFLLFFNGNEGRAEIICKFEPTILY